jgi:peptidoglycan/LPS O-acetylase OafA/YrhL
MFSLVMAYMPYLAGGVALAAAMSRLARSSDCVQFGILVISALGFVIAFRSPNLGMSSKYVLGGTGIMAVIAMSMLLAKRRGSQLLVLLGQASMAIYVLHTLFSAGARVLLSVGGLERHSSAMLALTTFAGLLFPLPLWYWNRQQKNRHLLGFGDGPRHPEQRRLVDDPQAARSETKPFVEG